MAIAIAGKCHCSTFCQTPVGTAGYDGLVAGAADGRRRVGTREVRSGWSVGTALQVLGVGLAGLAIWRSVQAGATISVIVMWLVALVLLVGGYERTKVLLCGACGNRVNREAKKCASCREWL
jgi:hypothetical protein